MQLFAWGQLVKSSLHFQLSQLLVEKIQNRLPIRGVHSLLAGAGD
jgi:hypothetical protein